MANRNRTVSATSLSKLPTMLLRKLSEAVKKDGAAGDRTTRQIQAAYERQEAELVRSLERTRRVLALLRDEPTTAGNERDSALPVCRPSASPPENLRREREGGRRLRTSISQGPKP